MRNKIGLCLILLLALMLPIQAIDSVIVSPLIPSQEKSTTSLVSASFSSQLGGKTQETDNSSQAY